MSVTDDFLKNVRYFPDWPKAGVNFVDIMPVLKKPGLLDDIADVLANEVKNVLSRNATAKVVGLEARGFLIGPLVAMKLKLPFICIRKANKLPGPVISTSFEKEYGQDIFEMQADAICPGDEVVILDDLLATGGTMIAAVELISKAQGTTKGLFTLVELKTLNGRQKLISAGIEVPLWSLALTD